MSRRHIKGQMVEVRDPNTEAVIARLRRKGDPAFDRQWRGILVAILVVGGVATVALAAVAAWLLF